MPSRFFDVSDETVKQDVGSQPGTQWTLSSFKQGSGVQQLRSKDMTKLWQSDGNQPHLINVLFARRTAVTHVSIYLDCKQDDSYTPTKISVRAGTCYHDLVDLRTREFEVPQGWKHFVLDPTAEQEGQESAEPMWVWLVQVCVLANHLNGKDTHIRRMVVWGPPQEGEHMLKRPREQELEGDASFKSEALEWPSSTRLGLSQILANRNGGAGGVFGGVR